MLINNSFNKALYCFFLLSLLITFDNAIWQQGSYDIVQTELQICDKDGDIDVNTYFVKYHYSHSQIASFGIFKEIIFTSFETNFNERTVAFIRAQEKNYSTFKAKQIGVAYNQMLVNPSPFI